MFLSFLGCGTFIWFDFSGSSGCFLFLNWLLSFFWLCDEVKHYLIPPPPPWPEAGKLMNWFLFKTRFLSWVCLMSKVLIYVFIFKDFIYLLLERGEGREEEKEKNINVWEIHPSVASCTPPNSRPGPQPRHVPWPGIEQVSFQFAGWHSIHWATQPGLFCLSLTNSYVMCTMCQALF